VPVPVLGRVAAGRPIEAIEARESVALPEEMLGRGETFVLRVQGESMVEEFIRDGDLVVVESRDSAANGETVIALVGDGEVTLKKFYRDGNRVRLQPENAALEPIFAPHVQILGKVVGVFRQL
jgi:repressor LexA